MTRRGFYHQGEDDLWERHYQGNSQGGAKTGGVQTYSPPAGPEIAILKADGTVSQVLEVPYQHRDWVAVAKTVYPIVDERLQLPEEHCVWEHRTPPFNACTYNATEDYLKARFGRALHYTDKDWLAVHPYATDDGIPEAYTATAVHQLVEPYGLGVQRIRVRAGKMLMGDELRMWAAALMCNPFGLVDKQTTNADAAERLQMTPEAAAALFRFEYHQDPLPCSVVGERGWAGTGTVQVGSGGGHARYLAPRAKANDWRVSIQLAPLAECVYHTPLALPAYVPRPGARILLLGKVTRPDGSVLAVERYGRWIDPTTAPAVGGTTITTVVSKADGSTVTRFTTTPTPSTTADATRAGALSDADDLVLAEFRDPARQLCRRILTRRYSNAVPSNLQVVIEKFVSLKASGVRESWAYDRTENYMVTNVQKEIEASWTCACCDQGYDRGAVLFSGRTCAACWQESWKGYVCPHCKVGFSTNPPELHSVGDAKDSQITPCANLVCGACKGEVSLVIDKKLEDTAPSLSDALYFTAHHSVWLHTPVGGTVPTLPVAAVPTVTTPVTPVS